MAVIALARLGACFYDATTDMDVREFQLFGLPHKTALAATVVGGIALLRYLRSSAPEARKDLVCKIGGLCLLLAVAADPVISYIRYGTGKLAETTLPFFLYLPFWRKIDVSAVRVG